MSSCPVVDEPGPDEVAPAWFQGAIENAGRDASATVHGASVHYRVWGPDTGPGLLLVHGGAAHAGWWDHVGPLMADQRRVIAVDLTGHGSSSSRTAYDFDTWADEIMGVADAEGLAEPVVVGHSMGGIATLVVAHRHADRLRGALVVDPPDWVLHGRVPPSLGDLPPRRHHARRDEAEQRFRARPADPARLPYVERHVARRSVRRVEDGWTWRFDHAVTTHDSVPVGLWGSPHCPVVLIGADRGMLTPQATDDLSQRLQGAPLVTIRDSGHHVMLDQPLALAAAIEGVLAGWAR